MDQSDNFSIPEYRSLIESLIKDDDTHDHDLTCNTNQDKLGTAFLNLLHVLEFTSKFIILLN